MSRRRSDGSRRALKRWVIWRRGPSGPESIRPQCPLTRTIRPVGGACPSKRAAREWRVRSPERARGEPACAVGWPAIGAVEEACRAHPALSRGGRGSGGSRPSRVGRPAKPAARLPSAISPTISGTRAGLPSYWSGTTRPVDFRGASLEPVLERPRARADAAGAIRPGSPFGPDAGGSRSRSSAAGAAASSMIAHQWVRPSSPLIWTMPWIEVEAHQRRGGRADAGAVAGRARSGNSPVAPPQRARARNPRRRAASESRHVVPLLSTTRTVPIHFARRPAADQRRDGRSVEFVAARSRSRRARSPAPRSRPGSGAHGLEDLLLGPGDLDREFLTGGGDGVTESCLHSMPFPKAGEPGSSRP